MKELRIVLKTVLVFCWCSVLFGADIKLRIYLQDGTLQSGNLITEAQDTFVILTRDGRVEVPKDKIMFINGKTLKQWQERPDKLFQTEILPSEVPNPAYINDKAALPAAPQPPAKTGVTAKTAIPNAKAQKIPSKNESSADTSSVTENVRPGGATASAAGAPVSAANVLPRATPVAPITPAAGSAKRPQQQNSGSPTKSNSTSSGSAPAANASAAGPASAATPPAVPSSGGTASQATASSGIIGAPGISHGHRGGRHHARESNSPGATATGPSVATSAPTPAAAAAAVKLTARSASLPSQSAGASGGAFVMPALPNDPALIFPPRFSRKEYADVYFQRALHYIDVKQTGAALHSLHLATLLDRQDPEPVFLLGKIYMEQGLLNRSKKYLGHPILKKREDAKALMTQIAVIQDQKQKQKYVLYGTTGVGAFSWIPLLLLLQKVKRPPRRQLTADDVQTILPAAAISSEVEAPDEILPILEDILAGKAGAKPAPPEPAFMKMPVPPAAPPIPATPPPAVPPPIIPLPTFSKPMTPSLPPPIVSPILPQLSPVAETLAGNPFVPPAAASMPDTESVLRLASMVEQAVRKGNAWAIDEQYTQARREYRTALALNPSCLEAHLGLAYLSFAQGQLDLALEHYGRCVRIDPSSADAHYGIGRVFLETDRIQEAVTEFQQTLTLDPSFEDARETLTSINAAA